MKGFNIIDHRRATCSVCSRKSSETEGPCDWLAGGTVVIGLEDGLNMDLGFVKTWFGPISAGNWLMIGLIKSLTVKCNPGLLPLVTWSQRLHDFLYLSLLSFLSKPEQKYGAALLLGNHDKIFP